jgi:hypothetical protein
VNRIGHLETQRADADGLIAGSKWRCSAGVQVEPERRDAARLYGVPSRRKRGVKRRVVFLDRASIIANIRRPLDAEYVEYDRTGPEQVLDRLAGVTVAITNKVPLREAALRQLPDLKMIAVAATGYDVVEVGYCRAHGVAVANIRNYAVHTVPEHAFALILTLRRNLIAYRADVERGAWQQSEQFCFFDHPILDLHGSQRNRGRGRPGSRHGGDRHSFRDAPRVCRSSPAGRRRTGLSAIAAADRRIRHPHPALSAATEHAQHDRRS